jgi:hypothetical protein
MPKFMEITLAGAEYISALNRSNKDSFRHLRLTECK